MSYIKQIFAWIFRSLFKKRQADWKVVVICIALAAVIWFLNALNNNYTAKVSYPVIVDYDKSQAIAIRDLPEKITLNVSGYGWNLFRKTFLFRVEPLIIRLENPVYTRYLTAGQLFPTFNDQLRDVKLNYIIMDTVSLHFERRVQEKVKVRVDSSNISLADGYRIVGPVEVVPDSVLFDGAASKVRALPKFIKVTVPEEEINEPYKRPIQVEFPDEPHLQLLDKQVVVQFNVALFSKRSAKVPITFINFPSTIEPGLKDSTVTVSYYIKEEEKDQIRTDSLRVIADYRKMNKQDSTVVPSIRKVPQRIYDLTIEPGSIRLYGKE